MHAKKAKAPVGNRLRIWFQDPSRVILLIFGIV